MTTNITDLPAANGLAAMPAPSLDQAPGATQPGTPSQSQIRSLVSGIQKASAAGATALPSRDIPQQTGHIVQDQEATPNHIPSPPEEPQYYIPDEDPQKGLDAREAAATKSNALEEFYREIHIPLLVSVLFLMFQLPVVQKYFRTTVPFAYNADGNQNIVGYTAYSALFGITFYGIMAFIQRAK